MKKLLLFTLAFLSFFFAEAQETYHDSTALAILDKMSQTIGELKSLKFKTHTSQDVAFSNDYLIKDFKSGEYIFQGPDRLLAKVSHNGKDQFYLYDGKQMVYYSLADNTYAAADAPASTLEMLDQISDEFGIELVVADFLYPDFTANLMENMDYIEFLGKTEVQGEKYFHIGGANDTMTFQIWVSQDLIMRPKRVVITYMGDPYARQLEVTFEDWQINQSYPESIFEFMPPPNSRQIIWTKKD
ncbi:hypothetical protein DFQ04_1507 [Algoriphagus boseongensis]|uniref:Outer membrane lipoprotein-sorting protein n=1 Tax=Algoriphagus boseongensis TaxID=1442587 RepID=A0A4R6TBR4_9BACT|nr:DUF2092 domain-containing protein [Algoriphagus boseongensis]TDQ19683.1 hypothetical protein DFQ04_1507 [Algoriphagus boseongensis]